MWNLTFAMRDELVICKIITLLSSAQKSKQGFLHSSTEMTPYLTLGSMDGGKRGLPLL